MSRTSSAATLVHVIGERSDSTLLLKAAAVLFMTALTAAAAQVSVSFPFTTVPFTMQPVVVLMAGLALGPRLGMLSQLLYLGAGMAGWPVFALSATLPPGAARLLGPTGGYLMAYPAAAFVAGWLAARGFDRRYITSLVAMVAGLAVIYAGGLFWLGLFCARPGSDRAGRPVGRACNGALSLPARGPGQGGGRGGCDAGIVEAAQDLIPAP